MNRNDTDRRETENRLDALEKSLAAASNSIMASPPWQPPQQQQQQHQQQHQQTVQRQETRQYETRHYETKSEQRQERQEQRQERQEQRQEQRFEQQSVSRVEMNGGYPRSMSPSWDNYPNEHVSSSLDLVSGQSSRSFKVQGRIMNNASFL